MSKNVEIELKALLRDGVLTKADIKVLRRWVDDMEEFGPEVVANSREWEDHELDRRWLGYRASAFSHSGRVIYKIVHEDGVVVVFRVTTDHNYKR
jgi:mRNA-degrading endonuclease YafQ of YafQ-DinJ toxin-antitoxin module